MNTMTKAVVFLHSQIFEEGLKHRISANVYGICWLLVIQFLSSGFLHQEKGPSESQPSQPSLDPPPLILPHPNTTDCASWDATVSSSGPSGAEPQIEQHLVAREEGG